MNKKIIKILLLFIPLLLIYGCSDTKKENKDSSYKVKYQNVDITPGTTFDAKKIDLEADVSEVPNCAFGDKGIIYTYDDLEITTDSNKVVYSVYFLSANITTIEGLSLGDNKDKMLELYGKDYKEDNNEYIYTKNGIKLSIIINKDSVKSIEYIKEG